MDARLEKKLACWQEVLDGIRERIGGLLDEDGFSAFARTRYIGLGGQRPLDLVETSEGMERLFGFIDETMESWEPHPSRP